MPERSRHSAGTRVEELDLSGQVVTRRRSYRDQHDRRFLPLALIDRADPSTLRRARPEKIDLHIVRADHEDVVDSDRADPPLSVGSALAQKALVQLANSLSFRLGFLRICLVIDADEPHAGRLERRIGIGVQDQTLPLVSGLAYRLGLLV